jgi:hypothetical protein
VGSERCRGTFQPVVAIDGQPLGFWEPVNCRPARVEARMRWPWSIEPGELPWPRLPGVQTRLVTSPLPGMTAVELQRSLSRSVTAMPAKFGGSYFITLEPRPNLWGRVVRWVRERGL